jgi:hypothetical protein
MNSPATARPPGRRRLALIAAGALALLGSFVVTAPAQAGYYEDSYYRPNPCSYRCGYGYPHYGYAPRYYNRCSSCGCYRGCGSGYRSGLVYERRYVEREYVERRYGCCRHHYGYGGYGGYRHYGGYYPDEGYRRPFPYGYGGVRYWQAPSGYYRFGEPYAEGSGGGYYEAPPRPPAPIDEY